MYIIICITISTSTTTNNIVTDLLTGNLGFPEKNLLLSNMKKLHLIIITLIKDSFASRYPSNISTIPILGIFSQINPFPDSIEISVEL